MHTMILSVGLMKFLYLHFVFVFVFVSLIKRLRAQAHGGMDDRHSIVIIIGQLMHTMILSVGSVIFLYLYLLFVSLIGG